MMVISHTQTTYHCRNSAILLLVISLILSGCSQQQPQPLTLGVGLQPSNALVIIADELNLFAQHGITVTTTDYPSGKRAMLEGLHTGQVDVISAAELIATSSAIEQRKFEILASLFFADNINSIVGRKDRGITDPQSLRDKRVCTQQNSAVHYFLNRFLIMAELTVDDIDSCFAKAEELPQLLVQGEIDAFSMREPYVHMALEQLGSNGIEMKIPGAYGQYELLLASADFSQKNPQLTENLLLTLRDAESFITANRQKAIELVAKRLGSSTEQVAKSWKGASVGLSLDQGLLLRLEDQANWYNSLQSSLKTAPPNFLDYINLHPLQKIWPQRVSIIH